MSSCYQRLGAGRIFLENLKAASSPNSDQTWLTSGRNEKPGGHQDQKSRSPVDVPAWRISWSNRSAFLDGKSNRTLLDWFAGFRSTFRKPLNCPKNGERVKGFGFDRSVVPFCLHIIATLAKYGWRPDHPGLLQLYSIAAPFQIQKLKKLYNGFIFICQPDVDFTVKAT